MIIGLASPFTLLEEAASADTDAAEVLLATFNANLAFFERFALGAARATRGRVTLVGDATAVVTDGRTRSAGITYLDGRAVVSGAIFHPKLVVIVGAESATVAIGSANVTLDGWHDNAELWTVLRADTAGCPDTMPAVADWLRALPSAVRLSAYVADAFARVAVGLDRFTPNEAGPKFVSNLNKPIISQLPSGPTDELIVSAPFLDKKGKALQSLIDHFRPTKLEVIVQPDMAVFHGPALASIVEEAGGTIRQVSGDRYHHGKLVEWAVDGRRFALTGSPNLSVAALARRTGKRGGNCEIGLLSEVPATLRPKTRKLTIDELRSHEWRPPRPTLRATIVLLDAIVEGPLIRLSLASALSATGRLERRETRGDWVAIGDVPASDPHPAIPVEPIPGQAVRIRAANGRLSNEVHILEQSRIMRTMGTGAAATQVDHVPAVLADWRLAQEVSKALAQLKQHLIKMKASSTSPAQSAGSHAAASKARAATTQSAEEWLYYDTCAASAGDGLVRFGLGLPRLSAASAELTDEDEDIEDTTFEHRDADADADEMERIADDEKGQLVDYDDLDERARRRFRTWCSELADASPKLVLLGRSIAARLIVYAVAGKLWDSDDEWISTVAKATKALGGESGFPQEETQAATMAAVGLALLRTRIPLTDRGPQHRMYEETETAVARLLPALDERLVRAESKVLVPRLGYGLSERAITGAAEMAQHDDPLGDTVEALFDLGWIGEVDGRLIRIVDPQTGDPGPRVLRALGLAQDHSPVAAFNRTSEGWAFGVWDKPELLVVRQHPNNQVTQHWKLTSSSMTLNAYAVAEGRVTTRPVDESPTSRAEALAALLKAVGIKKLPPG